jgi:hypothetical protein
LSTLRGNRLEINVDTGAAVTAFPLNLVKNHMIGVPSSRSYKTASGELVADQGGFRMSGSIPGGGSRTLNGRAVDVHRPLLSASACAAAGNDLWLGPAGGLILPRSGPVAQGLRRSFEKLSAAHGLDDTTRLHVRQGVYVMDLDAPAAAKDKAAALAPLVEGGGTGSSSVNWGPALP